MPISDNEAEAIKSLCEIASLNGSLLSLRDITSLTPISSSPDELEGALRDSDKLNSAYEVKAELLVERHLPINDQVVREQARRAQAESNLRTARSLASHYIGRDVLVISVGGSNSYQTASETDDLDYFCITRRESTWTFLTKALLLCRMLTIFGFRSLRPCFSCVMDEAYAEKEFSGARNALFARDALNAVVIVGSDYYSGLLGRNEWLGEYFPKIYRSKASFGSAPTASRATASKRFSNNLLYFAVGSYIKIKSRMLNRRLARAGKRSALFKVNLSKDHCVYESARYILLRKKYRVLGPALQQLGLG